MSTAGNTRFFAGATSLSDSGSGVFNVKSDGDITGSQVLFTGGKIGGFDITSSQINSTNDNLILLDSGQITGSTVLFTGGKIGGWDITTTHLVDDGNILNDAKQTLIFFLAALIIVSSAIYFKIFGAIVFWFDILER